ncbi:DsbA family oxidoreductase [Rummeliibacillus suwonensis]|uniref:DsbA family oxidoreductase n=1 Tax=Rummeliibacillus suwonensis TaxID=1306154 RepID=UPI0011B39B1B|nr:DsbA family oxidoreductase [Rummeliibacillus suwonensis]MBO2537397.1 DsbA family oxidoreductase [Rummeliibacillus suwonensis]
MKIEVWSDYVCPFCYIGKRELENAIEKTGFQDQVDIELKSYQLSPDSPATSEESIYEVLAKKYGTTIEQVKAQTAGIIDRAATLGLNYQYENMKPANTFKAHRLAKYAESVGKGAEMSERLLQAYFIENQEIGLTDILVGLGVEIGLERQAVEDVLNDGSFADEVLSDIQEASQIGIRGVPFFVFNGKYAISGAQPGEVFENAVRQVAQEDGLRPSLKMMGQEGIGTCTDGKCEL